MKQDLQSRVIEQRPKAPVMVAAIWTLYDLQYWPRKTLPEMVFSLPQFVTRMLPAKFIPCKVGPVPPWCSQRREARERLGLIASSCVLGCLLFFHRGSSNTLGCRTDLHTSTWSAASQKNFPSCLEAESEGWHLLTFWANSPLFVGLKIHFRYLDTKTQKYDFFFVPTGTGGEEAEILTIYQKGGYYI